MDTGSCLAFMLSGSGSSRTTTGSTPQNNKRNIKKVAKAFIVSLITLELLFRLHFPDAASPL